MKKKYFIILSTLLVIFFSCVLYLTALPAALMSNLFQKQIAQETLKRTGFDINIPEYYVKSELIPLRLNISTNDILLKNDTTNEFIKINGFETKIRILPVILGKISLEDTFVNHAQISIQKDYTKLLEYPQLISKLKGLKLKNLTVNRLYASISGQQYLNDLELKVNRTKIYELNFAKKIKLDTNILITAEKESSFICLNSDIKLPLNYKNIEESFINLDVNNLQLNIFSKTANKIFDKISNLEGKINLKAEKNSSAFASFSVLAEGFRTDFNDDSPAIYNSVPLNVKGNFVIDNNKIYAQSIKFVSDLIKASISGFSDISDIKNIKNNYTISVDKSDISEFKNLLPPLKDTIEEFDLSALKKIFISGNILGHLNVSGDFLQPDVFGDIFVSDLFVVKRIPNAPNATVKLRFNGSTMLLDTTVPTTRKEQVTAKGLFNLYGEKRCILRVKSTENIDLETAQTVVNPLQDILKLYFGPVPVMKLKGIANININVSGNRIDPNITGIFNFRNSTASFNDLPKIIVENMEGKLEFKGSNTLFQTENATLNSKPVNIKGSCDLYGKFDFKADTQSQILTNLYEAINDNSMLQDMNPYLDKLSNVKGLGDIKLHIYGNLKNVYDLELNKNTFVDTDIELRSAGANVVDMPFTLSNIFGSLSMKKNSLLLNLYALVNKSKIYINGKIADNSADIAVNAQNFRVIDLSVLLPTDLQKPLLTLINSEKFINFLPSLHTTFNAKYTGSIKDINYNNINLSGQLTSSEPSFKNVLYSLQHSNFKFSPVDLDVNDFQLNSYGAISNVFSKQKNVSGTFNLTNFNLSNININALKDFDIFSAYIKDLENMEGIINLNTNIQNNNVNGQCDINNVKISIDKKINEILNGKISIKNHFLTADNVNARIFEMPILLNGNIGFVNHKPSTLNLDIKAKPIQEFLNETFNKNALYPIKVKGNISLNTKITGTPSKINIASNLQLDKDSSIYYLGATVGDKNDAVTIDSDINLNSNGIKINDISYNKIVPSLNENENIIPVLNINGAINTLKDSSLKFNNLKIKSNLPVDAKIFNIIFRKPFVKEGVFTSDLVLNGTSVKPEIIGKLDVTSVELPFFESNINSINTNFTNKYINVISKGDVVNNEVTLNAKLKNDFTLPFIVEDVNIHLTELDLNEILNKLKNIEESNFKTHNELLSVQPVDYTNFIVNNSTLSADRVIIDKIIAKNFVSNVEINKNKILDVKNFKFNMADGSVDGNITHNYVNNDLNLVLNLNKADAANIAETLFNLKGQIFGLANGKINLNCNAENDKICLSTLSGNGYFEIQDGKMPKLGSLEYLLKAGNLINSGITGITINGIIDLLSPLKSGEFKNINGNFKIQDGIANDINIYSNGKDLNMYITGSYNLSSSVADFRIFGSLSKEITTVMNKVKNLSLNTLLKTIPVAKREKENEFSSDIAKIPMYGDANSIYKIFRVIINGNINENGFVKSFEWID